MFLKSFYKKELKIVNVISTFDGLGTKHQMMEYVSIMKRVTHINKDTRRTPLIYN